MGAICLDCFRGFFEENINRKWERKEPIQYTELFIPLNKIHITNKFSRTIPNPDKIAARVAEFKAKGHFDTEIVVDTDMVLQDGYTAYLVAKMFGLKGLRVLVEC